MNFLRALGRFLGPWLAFATLSGLFGGFILGAIVSLIALVTGVVTLVVGAIGGTALEAASEVAKAFPEFAFFVLIAAGWGFAGGFFAGLIAALVGGVAGYWWSFGVVLGGMFSVYPFYVRGHDSSPALAFLISTCGALLPLYLLDPDASKHARAQPMRQFLSQSWLVNPPQRARFAGIVLPFLLYGAWEIKIVLPEFNTHQPYVARLGKWTTWRSSKRLLVPQNRYFTSSCQSNLKQIGLGLQQYLADYDGIYPPLPQTAADGVGAIVQPYVKSIQLFQCPQELYRPQNPRFSSGDFSDYWFNARFYDLNEAKLTSPLNSVVQGDGNTGAGEANAAYSLRNLPPNWAPLKRHRSGGANYAFADGHVKWLKSGVISNLAAPRGGSWTMMP